MQNSFQTTSQRNSTLAIIQDQGQQSQNLLFQFSVKKNKNGKKKKTDCGYAFYQVPTFIPDRNAGQEM